MDVSILLQHIQYAVPVGLVLVCAVLVFAFGFKNAEQPPFAQLSAVSDAERKQATKKRSKIKEKRTTGNQTVNEKTSPAKKVSPAKTETKKAANKSDDVDGKLKEREQEENTPAVVNKKEKNQVNAKSGKENKVEQVKNKKNLKNLILEKPVDFDEGDWEQAPSRKDKKKKKEEETPKKTKKSKKSELTNDTKEKEQDKVEIKDKVAKETQNKELKEKNEMEIALEPVSNEVVDEPEVPEIKEEIKKVEKSEKDDKKSAKSKKAKKIIDPENNVSVTEKKTLEKVIAQGVEDAKTIETVAVEKVETVPEKKAPVFDELGDTWTEAKPQKKSKKKARKDN
ncbi:DNA ligase 1-like [Diachasmimorpha longicaudata]|uniref:DNA ligase 1-like n=1 Tax=Diachasmimorpha longicaudata TaxID=58733 RepID=UPI0030B8CE3D